MSFKKPDLDMNTNLFELYTTLYEIGAHQHLMSLNMIREIQKASQLSIEVIPSMMTELEGLGLIDMVEVIRGQ